ncbi:unnamed protein product [Merluccius merluccius]
MNTALRHWKEAATLILAAGTKRSAGGADGLPGPGGSAAAAAWDHRVLLLKRSSRSRFMPDAYVFPGGVADASDFSHEWLSVFRAFRRRHGPNLGLRAARQPAGTRPPMFATDRRALGSPVPGDVAFRICALRETFEECGVLLVVPRPKDVEEESMSVPVPSAGLCRTTDPCDRGELTRWRALVNENPANFLEMCRQLEVVPNIWALHEWGNWLTHTAKPGSRYDTAFYICCTPDVPFTAQDDKEIVHVKWVTPPEVLHSYRARELWVAPPQFYELSRLCRHPSLRELHAFASQRAEEGCEHWLPVILETDTHQSVLLPGDQLHPETGFSTQDPTTDPGLGGAGVSEPALHRMVSTDPYSMSIQISITPKYKHLSPLPAPDPCDLSYPNDPSNLKDNIKSHL